MATEVGADNRRVNCSNCGHLLGGAAGATPEQSAANVSPASGSDTRAEEARQLLDRWAKGHFFDPYGPPQKSGIDTESGRASQPAPVQLANGDSPGLATARQPEGYAMNTANNQDARNRETIDERNFLSDQPSEQQQQVESTSQPTNVPRASGTQAVVPSNSFGLPDERQNQPPQEIPTASDSATSNAAAAASAAELDRLTREIMNRVSRITEARDTANQKEAAANAPRNDSGSRETVIQSSFIDANEANSTSAAAVQRPDSVSDREQALRADGPSRYSETHEPASSSRPTTNHGTNTFRTDTAHQPGEAPESPGFSGSQRSAPAAPTPGGWYSNIGQVLAYLGIIFLTAGTCGVIVSYFGGPANYAPYGWLGATIGQMLLFLGIVTLISAGMEQTSQELRQAVDDRMNDVTQRLDQIGSRIMRIEEASSEGPPKPHLISQHEPESRRTSRTNATHVGQK